ncbi:endonuclease NucS domain-containing protein [Marinobacter sp.]|uniref:endonuclease NucS domain-containing protein n=1 Tax=Marinobacter sp. TaxID=50741 RepID=UPI00384E963A
MAIEQGIWKISDHPQKLKPSALADEALLEDQVMKDIAILNSDWLLIGRQVRTSYDKYVDLLAMDANGSVIIVELKRNKTPRDVVAQTIDYASWVVDLSDSDIAEIYLEFAEKYSRPHASLDEAFEARFRTPLADITINDSHQMVVVATELDASTERIINYLNYNAQISINALFFAAFEDNGNHYLSRAWMIDPDENQERAITKGKKEPWNGEFYTSFGDDRPWELARRFGFIAGGGANWYSKTLSMLSEGDRVWVNIPKTGYVGVGIVTGERCRADEYQFDTEEGPKTLMEMGLTQKYPHLSSGTEDETAEYLVPVRWLHTVDKAHAFSEVGLFGNQNTVCKPTTPKWSHTVNRLKQVWKIQ